MEARDEDARGKQPHICWMYPTIPPKKREPQGHPITHVNETTLRHPSYFRFKGASGGVSVSSLAPQGKPRKKSSERPNKRKKHS